MQVKHEISIKGVKQSSSFGLMSDDQFDVLFFAEGDVGQSDYDCYIEKSMMWVEHQEAESCEFVTERPDTIKQQVKEWSNSDDMFLSKD